MEQLNQISLTLPKQSTDITSSTNNSTALTRAKLSKSINALKVIGDILTRFRVANGLPKDSQSDHEAKVASWSEVLGVNQIPVSEYEPLYRKAMVTRAEKIKAGLAVFHLTPFDLIAEYKPEPKQKGVSSETCPEKHNHFSEEDALLDYSTPFEEEPLWLPCHVCRPNAFQKRSAEVKQEQANRGREVKKAILQLTTAKVESKELNAIDGRLDAICKARLKNPNNEQLIEEYEKALAEKQRILSEVNDDYKQTTT